MKKIHHEYASEYELDVSYTIPNDQGVFVEYTTIRISQQDMDDLIYDILVRNKIIPEGKYMNDKESD